MNKFLGVLLAACLASAVSGCESTGFLHGNPDNATVDDADYQMSAAPIVGAEFDALWDRARDVLMSQGYDIDTSRTRFADRLMVTRWVTRLSTHRFEGYRTRMWVRFHQDAPGEWTVGVAGQRQVNADIDDPQEIKRAKWEDRPAVEARATPILSRIESGFRDPNPNAADAK